MSKSVIDQFFVASALIISDKLKGKCMYEHHDSTLSGGISAPGKIKFIDKISLPDSMIPIDVDMDDYYIVICEKTENVFLFTCGLGPCIGVAALSSDDRTVIGVAHLYGIITSSDFPNLSSKKTNKLIQLSYNKTPLEKIDLTEILQYFQPFKFNKFIETIKSNAESNKIIDIYLGG